MSSINIVCIMFRLDIKCFKFQKEAAHAMEADPLEGRLVVLRQGGLVDEADGLQHVGDVVQAAYLCLQFLLFYVVLWYLPSSFFKRDVGFPSDEESDELLREDAEGLIFLVFMVMVVWWVVFLLFLMWRNFLNLQLLL